MSSGSCNKLGHVRSYFRHRYFRLLLVFFALVSLSQLLATFFVGFNNSHYLEKLESAGLRQTLQDWVFSTTSPSGEFKKLGDWCTEEEYLDGEWVKRGEKVTLDNIRKIFKYTDSGDLKCQARDEPYGFEPKAGDPALHARILETAQYEYRPRSGCRRHDWDRWNFAKFCLRSRGGCSVVGDSLADQIYVTLRSSMMSSQNSLFRLAARPDMSFSIFVNKEHADAEELAQEAGVSMDQLDAPVFVYYRDHHLVNRHELDEAFDESPGYEPLASGPPYSEQKFIADRSWWYERWTGLLRTPVKWNSDGAPAREEKSMIALSTGPHWSRRELWPKGSEAHQDSNDHILRGYQGAFLRVLQNITEVAKEHKVLAWWRSNTPGHIDCWQYDGRECE